jgi:signal transduction histidine kinase
MNQQMVESPGMAGDSLQLSRRLAPRLRGFTYFRAVLVLDRNGRVIHREAIQARAVQMPAPQQTVPDSPDSRSINVPAGAVQPLRMIPMQRPTSVPAVEDTRLALEYNELALQQEVEGLRKELESQIRIAVLISLVLLVAGLAYVIWAYKRNQVLQERARQADRLAYVGTLASGLAHEIRNPLNSMNMNIQLIQEDLDERHLHEGDEVKDMLTGVRHEIRRLEKMVSSFLAYARPTKLQTKSCQVNELVEDILQFMSAEIQKSGVKLETHFAENLPRIPLDEGQMRQALINVIQNAVQVLNPGEKMEITTRKAGGDKVLISIHDHGPGISKEELKNIFKVFYSTKRGGTGLGLATAMRIAEGHNGGIKVDSEVGRGSTFTFILPMEAT